MPRHRRDDRGRYHSHRVPGGHSYFYRLMAYYRERRAAGDSIYEIMHKIEDGVLDTWVAGGGGSGDGTGEDGGGGVDPIPKPPTPDPQQEPDVLKVVNVDFKVGMNTRQHNTDLYEMTEGSDPQLVVRRGQPFSISIRFSRDYDAEKDDLRLVFEIGETPKPSKKTRMVFILSDKDKFGEWGAKIVNQSDSIVNISVFTSPDSIVGEWRFSVEVVKRKNNNVSISRHSHNNHVFLLFNPWCKEDQVYMQGEMEKEAYVLRENGQLYVGHRTNAKPWFFGQFSGNVLKCCMLLLRNSDLRITAQGDPVKVTRKLSAMVNTNDEGGVLVGNWSGDYEDGTPPLEWAGSAEILDQYYRTETSVSYGQCWVFSGVYTAVCRALGIPCRSVTNFASAHDTDGSITIDKYLNKDMKYDGGDSVWNFHVWNETWMARPELSEGYGGWQVCDATPQENSDGILQCGPCPVRAIKEGEVNTPFDAPFIFAEVNADRIWWRELDDGTMVKENVSKDSVGKDISTLSMDGVDREDITDTYKYPEGSPEERVAVRRANQLSSTNDEIYDSGVKDVTFDLPYKKTDAPVGEDFEMELICRSQSDSLRTVQGHIGIHTMYYTGVMGYPVAEKQFEIVELRPGKSQTVTLMVKAEDYQQHLKDCCFLCVTVGAKVLQTNQIFCDMDSVMLRKPYLHIKAPARGTVGQEFKMEVSFANPMPTTLTSCKVSVGGSGLNRTLIFRQGNVGPKSTFFATVPVTLKKKGKRELVILFSSRELSDISGEHKIIISA